MLGLYWRYMETTKLRVTLGEIEHAYLYTTIRY